MKNYELYKHDKLYTIKELIEFCDKEYSDRTAFAYQHKKEDVNVSFAAFKADIEALGTFLFSNGYKNCHIAVYGENSYEWILAHFAVTCGGNVVVPIDKELSSDEISELLTDSDCKALIFSDTYSDIIEALNIDDIAKFNMKSMPDILAEGRKLIGSGVTEYIETDVKKDTLASIVYTSGTTGKSKGVMLTHYNLMSCMYGASCNAIITDTSLLVLPLHHTFGLVAGIYAPLFYGVPNYINKSLKNLSKDFQNCKPQNMFAVPLIVETLYKNIWSVAKKQGKDKALQKLIKFSNLLLKIGIDLRKKLFKSVLSAFGGNLDTIISGGAALDEKYVRELGSMGITVLNGYGITECGPIVAVNRNKFNIVGSVGLPLCCNEVKISGDGEILVKGDNVMQGYYHNDIENSKAFTDGWFKTGDIGELDKYGALHITGRIKNLIILSNGENIAAEGIETQIYNSIPYVKEVVVYASDDKITAEMFFDEEADNPKDRINSDINALNRSMPTTHNIGKIVIRDTEFPKTTTKKIKRNAGGNKNA